MEHIELILLCTFMMGFAFGTMHGQKITIKQVNEELEKELHPYIDNLKKRIKK